MEINFTSISSLAEVLSKVTINHKSFKLSLGGLGVFPSIKRANTLWAAVSGSLTELNKLQNEIHIELFNNGFILENRIFTTHITLASRPKLADLDLSVVQAKKLGEFMVKEVVLYESKAMRGKRTYIDLHRFSLYLSDH